MALVTTTAAARDAPEPGFAIGLGTPGWPLGTVPNGIVTYVASVAGVMRDLGHPVALLAAAVAPGDHDFPVYDIWDAWNSRSAAARLVHSALFRLLPRRSRNLMPRHAAQAARRIVREQGIQLIEMEESFGTAYWFQRIARVPVVVRLHGPWFLNGAALGEPRDAVFEERVEAEGRAIAAAAGVSAPSKDVLDRVRRHYGLRLEHAVVIPNPVFPVPDEERWRPESAEPGRVLFVGRFDRHKGGDLIIDAFARVSRVDPRARLTFVGPDRGFRDDAGRCWSLAEYVRERLPGAVERGALELLGPQPFQVVRQLRRRALVTVVPSRYETFAYTVAEALVRGCPTVAAAAGGIPEVVEDGVNGLLHRAGDAEDLARQILALLQDPARAARVGAAGPESCHRLRPDLVVPRMLDHYSSVLQRAG